jgi:hypothetical protein
MKKAILLLAMILISSAAFAQADLTTGEQTLGEIRLGIYTHTSDGNQDWVREFDGRSFGIFGIEQLNSYGFNGPTQYWLDARDLIIGDEDVSFSLATRNKVGISLGTSKLTHRLFRTPSINPFIAEMYANLGLPAPVPGNTGDSILDLSPGAVFHMDRRVNDFALHVTPKGSEGSRFVASWWQELENGTRQHIFRARAAAPGIIANRQRGGAATPIDRSTNESTLGADLRLGKASVVNYRFSDTEFSGGTTRPGGTLSAVNPLNALTQFDSKTTNNSLRARSKLSDTLYFTGTHSTKDRSNLTSKFPTGYDGAGTPTGAKVKVQNTNLGLTFLATDVLSVTGRWRKYELDNEVPPAFSLSGTPPVPAADATNMSLSREVTSTEVNASYTGIPKAYLKLGFENRDTERLVGSSHPPLDESDYALIRESTETNILRFGARYHPTHSLSFSANLEDWNTDNAGYAAAPTDRKKISANATYMVKSNLALYGDFVQSKDENKEVRVASIPTLTVAPVPALTPAEAEAYAEERLDAAGQGYKNDMKTTMLGAWYGLTPKLSLDTYWSKSSIDADATLIFGFETGYLPHLAPDFAPYQADTDQWSLGAIYKLSPKWRLNGRFLNSRSQGKTLISVLPGGLGPTWTPVDVDSKRWTLGFAYDISPKDRLILDYSILDWKDHIDSGQSGRFNLLRLAWSSSF